ncbi:MAG TPA: endonuclease III domain-containing protein [Desulfitobacteriaceae bacterium]|nr:endonuclease III domain-containing protein [Desulfitobacteriaceae bacterium]
MKGLTRIYDILFREYGQRYWWPASTPYEMMVGAILTQNTAWTNVEKALANFEGRLSPQFIASVSGEELARIIRPSGYYNQKALRLKALTAWFEKYSYEIEKTRAGEGPTLRTELLSVQGIGRETADSILTYALNKPFFIVDAYTRRLLSRFGCAVDDVTGSYEDLRLRIENTIPRDLKLYNEFHALIVEHAKRYCRKLPLCAGCPLKAVCCQRILEA